MLCCLLVGAMHDGCVPDDRRYLKDVCRIKWRVNFEALIQCGFLEKPLADASTLQADAVPESRVQRSKKDKKELNGHREAKKGPPRHLAYTKDHSRVYCKFGTPEWAQYADDYRDSHGGVDPPMQWDGDGSWFNWSGEAQH